MDKGQHLRLVLAKQQNNMGGGSTMAMKVIALATDLTFHVSAQTEDSTTKDSSDNDGTWQENEVTALSYDIQIGAMIGVGDDDANTLNDIIKGISDQTLSWDLVVVSGENNRNPIDLIASGMGKLTNVNPTGTNRQAATYTATLNGFGPYVVNE